MNWRTWLKTKLDAAIPITSVVPTRLIFGAGSLSASPAQNDRPFIVIRTGLEDPELNDGDAPAVTSQFASVWVHDNPGSYDQIDALLLLVRQALVGQVPDNTGIACVWQGDSVELADDTYGTIVRNGNYRLLGKVA